MKTPDSELRRLTDRWHDGTLTQIEGLRFDERLRTDPAARTYLCETAEIEAGLAIIEVTPTSPVLPRKRWSNLWKWAAVFVFGAIFGGAGSQALRLAEDPKLAVRVGLGPRAPIATISGMRGVVWADDSTDASVVLTAGSGREISAGLLEVTFDSGVRVLVEGPAKFSMRDREAMEIEHGKLVADVPKGAEGFTVGYPQGEIIDLGTTFAADVRPRGRGSLFGVFRGEIECRPGRREADAFRIHEDHAVMVEDGRVRSVPFDRSSFVRELPSREFPLAFTGDELPRWEFDVSHLIYRPGEYRLICKLMDGQSEIVLGGAELCCDGKRVAGVDRRAWLRNDPLLSQDNLFAFDVPPADYRHGHWTVRLRCTSVRGDRAGLGGVAIFEEGLVSNATAEDFIGTWEYMHNGRRYCRTFHPDRSASLTIDGQPHVAAFAESRWEVVDGMLALTMRHPGGKPFQELHCLRSQDVLIFVNRPYRSAGRTTPK